MSSINRKTAPAPVFTHAGTKADRIPPRLQLIRTVMTCMLWEDGFYENGVKVADRIRGLVYQLTLAEAAAVAVEARNKMKLRHVPLLIVREMARHPRKGTPHTQNGNDPGWISQTLAEVIQRPDELTEFLAIYWAEGKQPLSKQVKRGLAKAFSKFSEYQLAKYNRDKDITLKDVLFLCHSKPSDATDDGRWTRHERKRLVGASYEAQSQVVIDNRPNGFSPGELLYGKIIYDQLASPETWENRLSRGEDKRTVFTEMLQKGDLGDLAFLRNLRNMTQAGVPRGMIVASGDSRRWGRVLPFRFVAAAQLLPELEHDIERWMLSCLEGQPRLTGRTAIVVDTSPSMWQDKISARSELTRFDAAAALAILVRGLAASCDVYAFNNVGYKVASRSGFALRDALASTKGSASCGGIAVKMANAAGYDRIIVLTDGQWHPDDGHQYAPGGYRGPYGFGGMATAKKVIPAPLPGSRAYLIDVSGNQNGIGYGGGWLHIDGWSEAIIDYIQAYEADTDVQYRDAA